MLGLAHLGHEPTLPTLPTNLYFTSPLILVTRLSSFCAHHGTAAVSEFIWSLASTTPPDLFAV